MLHLAELMRTIESSIDPVRYIQSLKSRDIPEPYWWQKLVLSSSAQFIHINAARRAGKSVITSCIPAHTAKFQPGSVTLILGPTKQQASEDMRLVRSMMLHDPTYPEFIKETDTQVELTNKSRIIIIPATEIAARGYPDPDVIITDEAAFITDVIHRDCLAPMLNDNPHCKWLQISTTNGKMLDPGRFFYECSLDPLWERYEIRAPFDVDPRNSMNLIDAIPEKIYKAERAKHGIIAGYSPRHMDRDIQLRQLSIQGPGKYQRNQLALFVDTEEQAFSYDDIKRAMNGESNGLIPHIEEAEVKALFT